MTPMSITQFNKYLAVFRNSIMQNNIELYCQTMKNFFADVPYTLHIGLEKYYLSMFYIITKIIGAQIDAEEPTNIGRIDAVINTTSHVYVIEFKFKKSANVALKQIFDKKYYEKYKITGKQLTLIGLTFNLEEKNISSDWVIKNLDKQFYHPTNNHVIKKIGINI